MAELVQPRAGEIDQDLATNKAIAVTTKPKLGGAIAAGLLAGAVAAFLVGGLAGVTETTTSVVHVAHSFSAP